MPPRHPNAQQMVVKEPVYLTEVRRWLAATESPDVRTGLVRLRKMLSLAMSGVYGARQ